jgi:uncharacterized membrane protein YbhN (UPF0104 family)
MVIALSQFDREGLVGALLLFRLLYYIVPFAFALAIVAFREFVFKPQAFKSKPRVRRRPSTAA